MTPLEYNLLLMVVVMAVVLICTQIYINKLENHKLDFGEKMYKLGIDYGRLLEKTDQSAGRNTQFYEEIQKLVEKK
jgi:hypothetical protein